MTPFQPTLVPSLLDLVNLIFPLDEPAADFDLISPIIDLEAPQAAIVLDESAIPWLWEQWSDPRLFGAKKIVKLVGDCVFVLYTPTNHL
jgi:hypothetical protein